MFPAVGQVAEFLEERVLVGGVGLTREVGH